jgi:hypothetical protein
MRSLTLSRWIWWPISVWWGHGPLPTAFSSTFLSTRGGGDHRAMGAVDALDCGEGGGIAGTTRMTMTRKQTSASSPMAAAAAAAATTAIARCSTASGIATTTRGPSDDDGDVEAPAVRVTDWWWRMTSAMGSSWYHNSNKYDWCNTQLSYHLDWM